MTNSVILHCDYLTIITLGCCIYNWLQIASAYCTMLDPDDVAYETIIVNVLI